MILKILIQLASTPATSKKAGGDLFALHAVEIDLDLDLGEFCFGLFAKF